jgi:hypothetical protein
MIRDTTFYTDCMNNETNPGFVPALVGEAGRSLEGLGALFSSYGGNGTPYTASILGVRSLAIGHFRDNVPLGKFACIWLKQIGVVFAIHIGLGLLGWSVTNIGKWMQARETQCAIGQRLGGRSKL